MDGQSISWLPASQRLCCCEGSDRGCLGEGNGGAGKSSVRCWCRWECSQKAEECLISLQYLVSASSITVLFVLQYTISNVLLCSHVLEFQNFSFTII